MQPLELMTIWRNDFLQIMAQNFDITKIDPETFRAMAVRIPPGQTPRIDGRLDEPDWQAAERSPRFADLIGGRPGIHDTRAAVLWDDTNLYVGYWIEEPFVEASLTHGEPNGRERWPAEYDVLDRETGRPVFGIEERPVPQTDVPGEWTSPTQPFPTRPAPFARQSVM